MRTPETAADRHAQLRAALDATAAGFDLVSTSDDNSASSTTIRQLRRRRRRGLVSDTVGVITLTEIDGVLFWTDGTRPLGLARRGLRRGMAAAGEVICQYRFDKLGSNDITRYLAAADDRLTPAHGLNRYENGMWQPVAAPRGKKRILLLVHGTFSDCGALLDNILSTQEGRDLIAAAQKSKAYDEILGFNHPTLSVNPLMNAVDLARAFANCPAKIDLIAHSRGGIVARWFLDALRGAAAPRARAVLVGSPLGGTSLASPCSLRASMSLLTNFGNVINTISKPAAGVFPLLEMPRIMMRVFTSITGAIADAPLLDAAVALVPGLFGQSRVANNSELTRLLKIPCAAEYCVITSNFEPADEGWRFWRYFRKTTVADFGADFVFEGENDLVVNTDAMAALVPAVSTSLDFGTNPTVHHCNYFSQPKTIAKIASHFGLSAQT